MSELKPAGLWSDDVASHHFSRVSKYVCACVRFSLDQPHTHTRTQCNKQQVLVSAECVCACVCASVLPLRGGAVECCANPTRQSVSPFRADLTFARAPSTESERVVAPRPRQQSASLRVCVCVCVCMRACVSACVRANKSRVPRCRASLARVRATGIVLRAILLQ